VHGAYGYVQEAPIARIYRDAKAYEMIQGTLEIQRAIVARGLLAANRPAQFTGSG
jgi:alkylation response protein AidB-like acyl-CoA dehydrogenase